MKSIEKKQKTGKVGLKERLESGDFVLCGEGYLFELERRGYVAIGPFVPTVVLENPDAIKELHREFVRCGSDIVEAFTYYAHKERLGVVGMASKVEEINTQALNIAKEVATESGTLVAGNICNSNVWSETDEKLQEEARNMFEIQIDIAKEAGVDLIIAETFNYGGEAIAALETIKKMTDIPAVVTMAVVGKGNQLRDSSNAAEVSKILAEKGATVVGLNCATGPDTMLGMLKDIKVAVGDKAFIGALPVPFRTTGEYPTFQKLGSSERPYLELERHRLNRFEMGDFAVKAREIGASYLGVCCGGAPYDIRAMAEALGRKTEASKYSADISKHFSFGTDPKLLKHNVEWKFQS